MPEAGGNVTFSVWGGLNEGYREERSTNTACEERARSRELTRMSGSLSITIRNELIVVTTLSRLVYSPLSCDYCNAYSQSSPEPGNYCSLH